MATAPDLQSYLSEDTIFITPTGSRLYGLETPESDYDFTVVSSGKRISTADVTDHLDIRRVDFITLSKGLRDKPGGVYLEAIYSQEKILGPRAPLHMGYLDRFVPALPALRASMFKMASAVLHEDLYKRVRFAVYLASRWNQWYWSGQQYYDPRLTAAEREAVELIAQRLHPLGYEERRAIFSSELFFPRMEIAQELYQLNLDPRGAYSQS